MYTKVTIDREKFFFLEKFILFKTFPFYETKEPGWNSNNLSGRWKYSSLLVKDILKTLKALWDGVFCETFNTLL